MTAPSYQAAFRAFFYGDFTGTPGGQLPSGFGVVRVVDRRAWLERVRITPAPTTATRLTMEGRHYTGPQNGHYVAYPG